MTASDLDCSWIRPIHQICENTVVYVDLAQNQIHEQHALNWLDENEMRRWQRYRVNRAKREFALCRAALRHLICRELECENYQLSFGVSDYGKPYARVNGESVSVRFNISHSVPYGLIAITQRGRVGIDVEKIAYERDFDGIAKVVFGPDERADIASTEGTDKAHLFLRFWTLKEALVKALGTGLTMNLIEFEIPSDIRNGSRKSIFQFPGIPETHWVLEDLSTPDYIAAVAFEIMSRDFIVHSDTG